MHKNTLLSAILIIICVFFTILSFSLFRNMKNMELEFNEKRAVMVREALDLKDKITSLEETLKKNGELIDSLEKDKKAVTDQLNIIKEENEKLVKSYAGELDSLKKKQVALKKRLSVLEDTPLIQHIKTAIDKEQNEEIKKVLEEALKKIELIKAGKPIELEPIIMTEKESKASIPSREKTLASEERKGVILSVDRKNSLIVINLGTKDDMKEGDRLLIMKGGEEIAQAEVLSVRYRIAAAFIDDIKYRHTLKEIKEGFNILVLKR